MDKEPDKLTPDDLYRAIMDVWARRTERELNKQERQKGKAA